MCAQGFKATVKSTGELSLRSRLFREWTRKGISGISPAAGKAEPRHPPFWREVEREKKIALKQEKPRVCVRELPLVIICSFIPVNSRYLL